MIVVDTNVLAYLWLPGERTAAARALLEEDGAWVAPRLWRSEMRNILATYVRAGKLTLKRALEVAAAVEEQMRDSELDVETDGVLALASRSGCTAYDCEFVALAQVLETRLVTADRKLAAAFPERARLLGTFP